MFRHAKYNMAFKFARFLAALALLASLDGLATAQTRGNGVPGRTGVPNTSATAALTGPAADAGVEPGQLGMLPAQNEMRQRLGLNPLTRSAELASRAEAVAKAAAGTTCSFSSAERVARAENASVFWASAMRRIAGGDTVQDISASYVISRWSEGARDFDPAKGLCRTKSSSCEAYSRLAARTAKSYGCARTICSSQAQIWICLYSEKALR